MQKAAERLGLRVCKRCLKAKQIKAFKGGYRICLECQKLPRVKPRGYGYSELRAE